MPKILVTGSTGFIGSYLIDNLERESYVVLGIDKIFPQNSHQKKNFVECNILDRECLEKIVQNFSPAIIIHLAARTDLDEKKNIEGYASNIKGVKNLIEVIRQNLSIKRCIFTSSQLVCKIGYIPKNDHEYNPPNLYGESKVLTEKIVRQHDGGKVEWCLVRPTTVWGPGMSVHYRRLLNFIQKEQYFHVGTRELYKSYGYIGNVAYQYQKLMEAPVEKIQGKTFYLADYQPISLRHWTNLIQQELKVKPIPSYPEFTAKLAAKVGDVLNFLGWHQFPFNSFRLNNILTEYVFDLSETKKICGNLPYTPEQGVKEMVNWARSQGIV